MDNNSYSFFEPKNQSVLRIIPYPKLAVETAVHRLGSEAIYCPARTGPHQHFNHCPICDFKESLETLTRNGKHSELKKTIAKVRPVERYFLNVVERGSTELKVMNVSKSVYRQIIDAASQKPKLSFWRKVWNWLKSWVYPVERPSIFDLEEYGHDFLFTVEQKKLGPYSYPLFTVKPQPTPSPAGTTKQIKEWKETAPDLLNAIPFIPQRQVSQKLQKIEDNEFSC